ncbi:hypothetical protein [Clostridium neonatale]|uniref:hypothetical protein n=1 Tax=Clostridium neonatale TaxID=137838 RepID=UPI00397BB715
MDNNLNWNIILQAMSYKIQQLEEKVMICNCCEKYANKLDDVQAELLAYKNEYRNILIVQQKSNK